METSSQTSDAAAAQTNPAQAARPRRRRFRYSLRTLLVVVTLVGVVLGVWVQRAERQRRAVAAMREDGGKVMYDYEESRPRAVNGDLPGPDWLCRLLGVDYFANVTHAHLSRSATDATLSHLGDLTSLKSLWLDGTQVTDTGLAHLTGLARLQELDLSGTQVTDAGCDRLQQALPNCAIVH